MQRNESQSTTNTRWVALVAGGLLFIVFILLILSNALPSWGVPKPAHAPLSVGLWRECRTFSWRYGINECSAITLTCSGVGNWFLGQCLKLMMARTFIIMACIFSGFGAILLVLIGIRGEGNPRLIILGKVIVIVSLICSIIGFAVGISWILYGGWQLGAAAILAIVAAALNLLIAVFVLVILTSKSTSTTQM